jgi:hypothetical protein
MPTNDVSTYLDSTTGSDLEPSRTRLLFSAWIDHGPGASEKAEYRIGPSQCGQFDVLWISSDFDDGESRNAAAWTPRHQMKGKALWLALLKSLFTAERASLELEQPNFSEVAKSQRSLLSSGEVCQAAISVFGEQ